MTTTALYHGTTVTDARAIAGPPPTLDITRGSGEFGRGFYFGVSAAFAKSWAANRSREPALLAASPLTAALSELKSRTLDQRESEALRVQVGSAKKTYLANVDFIVGTIENHPRRLQYKFESLPAQDFLRTHGELRVIT